MKTGSDCEYFIHPHGSVSPTSVTQPLFSGPSSAHSPSLCLALSGWPATILAVMDHLWTPWRYAYVSSADGGERQGVPRELAAWPGDHHCVFCNLIAAVEYAEQHGTSPEDAEQAAGIIFRAEHNFLCLNAYPYASGHVMVVPYLHADTLSALDNAITHEMIDIARQTESLFNELYAPQGMNFGLNLGKAAGAGIAGHLHLHALPRWTGDTNFMTTIGETRVLPESLDITWHRMRQSETWKAWLGGAKDR
jgi:ATP adenylyltransferase